MSITNFSVCPICGTKLKYNIHFDSSYIYNVNCPACGRFAIDEDYCDDVIDRPVISHLKSENTLFSPCIGLSITDVEVHTAIFFTTASNF